MSSTFVAKIAIDNKIYHIDKLYSYLIPETILGKVQVGSRVLAPFGIGNKQKQAVVFEIVPYNGEKKLKEISYVLDDKPFFSDEMLKLAFFMKERYFCTLFDAIRVMTPSGTNVILKDEYVLNECTKPLDLNFQELEIVDYIRNLGGKTKKEKLIKKFSNTVDISAIVKNLLDKDVLRKSEVSCKKMNDATIKKVKLVSNELNVKLTKKQTEVIKFLIENKSGSTIKEVTYFTGAGRSVVESLVKKGFAKYFECKVYRDPYEKMEFENYNSEINLTPQQREAYSNVYKLYRENKYNVSLLYGVTGSGKTSVFMKLIDAVVSDNRGVIVMVPEIALTPQIVRLFKTRYANNVAVFHSALSQGERFDEFRRVKNGIANIVVGTRSAAFAPVKNLGLIVMDEEQESTYKSDKCPRYHARDIAKFRSYYNKNLLLLSSATPSLESFYFAKEGKYSLSKLEKRYNGDDLPETLLVDMGKERETGNFSNFSNVLKKELESTVSSGHQAILLLNRRGYNTYVSCRNCGEVICCPNCSISMTYHSANSRLMCHYCGYSKDLSTECPSCHSKEIKLSGVGIQKVEEELKKFFPNSDILRMDTDTVGSKLSYEEKLNAFFEGKYQIMLGTQMVAKGFNFPNVTLVGVLLADQTLFSDDFRSYEKTFSLLTQVIGRSGRGENKGKAIIQTFSPEHSIINLAKEQNYEKFYNSEIQMRKVMLYPPFSNICIIGFVGKNEKTALLVSHEFCDRLKILIKSKYCNLPVRLLGPAAAGVLKVDNKYRYKIIIKYKNSKDFRNMVSDLLLEFGDKKKSRDVAIFVDVNPDTIL